MKRIFGLCMLLCLAMGFSAKSDRKAVVIDYYQAWHNYDFETIKLLAADSLTMVEGSYVMKYDKTSLYQFFKWDSVTNKTYKLLDVKQEGDTILATLENSCTKFAFLGNGPLICDYKINFKGGAISTVESLGCKNANWALWQSRRDSLVKWIEIHHPNLDGFINDMTAQGAVNYNKAIELFEKRTP